MTAPRKSQFPNKRWRAMQACGVTLLALAACAPASPAAGAALDPSLGPTGGVGAAAMQPPVATNAVHGGAGTQAAGSSGTVLVYRGNESSDDSGGNASYTDLELATGRGVESTESLPGDLSGRSCVLLQLNAEPFSGGQIATLHSYIQGGGVVVGIGEFYGYDNAANNTLSNVAASLGSNLSFDESVLDSYFHETTAFGSSPYAAGLSVLSYAATSGVEVSGSAEVVARTQGGAPFIGSQAIGAGALVMVGDSNVLSDYSDVGYTNNDNGTLAQNLCGEGGGFSHPWPADGYGYSFENRAMNEYAAGAGLHPSDILVPSQLASTFTDWTYHRILSGFLPGTLQAEIEAATGLGPLGRFWQSMLGGTCYGLALSGGRFAELSDLLFSPGSGRSDPTWDVGSGPSASIFLPEPHQGESPLYNKQFLQMDANDFLTQLSREAQFSFGAQAHAFANVSSGVASLRQQLESVMTSGDDLYGSLSGPPTTHFALISLLARDSRSYGHEVLAYGFETLAGGGLKIDVWDNNFPGQHHSISVNSDGTWNYLDAPYPSSGGYRYFGSTYSLRGAGGHPLGNIEILPVYKPSGLHLYPGAGSSIVDIGSKTTTESALDAEGNKPSAQLAISGALEYAGETLIYETEKGSLDVGGADPSLDVRGPDTYMALDASSPVHVNEDVGQGAISASGGPVSLLVTRNELKAQSEGASSLALNPQGSIAVVADGSGSAQITLEYEEGGSLEKKMLFSGQTAPGENLTFSPADVAAAQHGAPATPHIIPSPSAGQANSAVPPAKAKKATGHKKCKKGQRKRRTRRGVRCVKATQHHRGKHSAG